MRFARSAAAAALALALSLATPASAHCDGLDGPVVTAARQALEANDPNRVLIWVQPADEAEIRAAFSHAVAVRRLGPEARELADRFFFETLVRLHRAGEGAPYTGLQPAGRDLGPAIPLADRAVASGSDQEVAAFIGGEVERGIHARFQDLQRLRRFDPADLAAGRAYVASYVSFIHYVEGIDVAARSAAEGHYPEASNATVASHPQGH
jgi:hypothetical protein